MNAIVSEKGQVTIPKPFREKLGIRPGTLLAFDADHGKLTAVKLEGQDMFQKWRGKGKLPGNLNVDQYLEKVRG